MVAPGASSEAEMRFVFPITMVTAMVSPSARPKPRIEAPSSPGRAASSITPIASARVAPIASAASRRLPGSASRIWRDSEMMVGDTMTASTIPAFSIPIPNGKPRKSGRNPRWATSQGSSALRSHGASTNRPQIPYTMLGIAASSSTRNATASPRRGGASSARKTAVPTPSGRASVSARADETIVP